MATPYEYNKFVNCTVCLLWIYSEVKICALLYFNTTEDTAHQPVPTGVAFRWGTIWQAWPPLQQNPPRIRPVDVVWRDITENILTVQKAYTWKIDNEIPEIGKTPQPQHVCEREN